MSKERNKKLSGLMGLALALLIAISVYLLLKSPKKSTFNKEEIDFAVKDTASVQKILITGYIEGQAYGKVYLTKSGGEWWVNHQFKAHKVAIEHLLNTIYALQLQQPLHPNAIQNVKKLIQRRNVHVVIQDGRGNTLKAYFIGPATPNTKGNYLLLEGAETPYIAEIPGFEGYFSTRFSPNPDAWKDYTLWSLTPQNFEHFELKNKAQKTVLQVQRKAETYYLNRHKVQDSTIIRNIEQSCLELRAAGSANASFPNAKDSLPQIPPDYSLRINQQEFLLWQNPYGAYFIAPKSIQKTTPSNQEILLLQKLTVQRWLSLQNF